MKAILFFTLMIVATIAQSNNYYLSFIEAAGINVKATEGDVDCSQVISDALTNIKTAFGQEFTDIESLLDAMTIFVEKVKYEVSPVCRDLSSDFEFFLSNYHGDTAALKENAEDNLDAHYFVVGQELTEASNSLVIGEESEAGKIHGKVLRTLLGLNEQKVAQAQTQEVAEKSSDSSDDVFGEVYRAYINEISILNSVSEEASSDKSSDVEQAPVGYVSGLISRFQQIKKGASATRQLQEKSFGANSYNMDL